MTGSNTDAVYTNPAEQAIRILLRLSAPVFNVWVRCDGEKETIAYFTWAALRRMAARFADQRNTLLNEGEESELATALSVAHGMHHEQFPIVGEIVPRPELCACPAALLIRELKSTRVEAGVLFAKAS